jgi:hypothetical protein
MLQARTNVSTNKLIVWPIASISVEILVTFSPSRGSNKLKNSQLVVHCLRHFNSQP